LLNTTFPSTITSKTRWPPIAGLPEQNILKHQAQDLRLGAKSKGSPRSKDASWKTQDDRHGKDFAKKKEEEIKGMEIAQKSGMINSKTSKYLPTRAASGEI
jgi:hypothetical protein